MPMFAIVESPELFVEPVLGFDRNGNNICWLSLSPAIKNEIGTTSVPIVPGRLGEDAASVGVACFGDGTAAFTLPGRPLGWNETEVTHEGPRRTEATDVADL